MAQAKSEFDFTRRWMKAQPTVAAFIAAMTGGSDYHAVDDLLQEVALALFENFEKYDPAHPFAAWALGVTRNKLRMRWRSLARSKVLYADEELVESLSSVSLEQSERLEERQHAMHECVQQLEGRTWQAIKLRYYDDLSPKAVAQKLKLTAGNVRVLLGRVRATLRECVRRRLDVQGGGAR